MKSNTQLATKQIRLQQWTAIICDRQQSGMKVDEYCQSRGITRDMYFYLQMLTRILHGKVLAGYSKKNFVMIDTVSGANASAIIYSLVETARANDLNVYQYMKYLLTVIPNHIS